MRYSNETKENFCGACLAIPLAIAGLWATKVISDNARAYETDEEEQERARMYTVLMWVSVFVTIVSIIAMIWYWSTCKKCNRALKSRSKSR